MANADFLPAFGKSGGEEGGDVICICAFCNVFIDSKGICFQYTDSDSHLCSLLSTEKKSYFIFYMKRDR